MIRSALFGLACVKAGMVPHVSVCVRMCVLVWSKSQGAGWLAARCVRDAVETAWRWSIRWASMLCAAMR